LRIIEEGELQMGDEIAVTHQPDHGVTMKLVFDAILHDHTLIPQAIQAPELPASLRDWLTSRIS